MKTILQILGESGGLQRARYLSIENEPWMRLVIEVLPEPGPGGHPVVCVAHYGEQNSDPMRDPEMLFEVIEEDGAQPEFWPFYFRNDYAGIEQWSRYRSEGGDVLCLAGRTREMEQFMKLWDRNLSEQGFLDAFRRQAACASSAKRSG